VQIFSNSDPLVRETSLRLLRAVGVAGAANAASDALAALLADPEPNVRAAVLKQLAEQPDAAMTRQVVKYVAAEHDVDLVVHAIRALRAARGRTATTALLGLLQNENWRVRAEAADALAEMMTGGTNAAPPPAAARSG